jgi:hypothetical protein
MQFPRLLPVRQKFPDRRLPNVADEVRKQLTASGFADRVRPGARIALGVGSRGIANLSTIVRATVDFWKDAGCAPFIFPSMGSHGAATAAGQADVLAHYGVSESAMGCPLISALDVVSLGNTAEGVGAFMDKNAFESDGVMLIGRVKWHTDFAGKIESGLFKMMAIGLGKFAGAQRYHAYAYRHPGGLEHIIRTVGRQVLTSGKILGGLAILEDAHHHTAHLAAIPASEMESREEEMLALVKTWMARLPMPLDILIVNEIGKNISGSGMDTKVVNRHVYGGSNTWDTAPRIERVFLRDMSDNTYGNAVGIGMADVIHASMLAKVDWDATRINVLTACSPPAAKIPLHFSSDRECLERIAPTTGRVDMDEVTIGWIKNSMELVQLKLSENLLPAIQANALLEVIGPPEEMSFDEGGNLLGSPLVEEVAAH